MTPLRRSPGPSGTPAAPGGGIFLSYRREEAGHAAGRLADRIVARFGDTRVFIDVDSIPPGEDFVEAIRRAVAGSDVLLALIGRQWTSLTDGRGRRRLDDPGDFVVLEIGEALRRDTPVVPVLLDGAAMPRPEELPAVLQELPQRNAVRVDAESFRRDAEDLLDRLAPLLPGDDGSRSARAGPPVPAGAHASGEPSPAPPPDSAGTRGGGPLPQRISRRTLLRTTLGVATLSAVGAGTWAGRALLDRPTRPRWIFETGGQVYSTPAVQDGSLYVGSRDAHLYAVDARTGAERWRHPTGGPVTSSPAVAAGTVYVGSNDMALHAVDAGTGTARWTFPTGGALHSSPAVAGRTVFVGSRDNHVYAVDAVTGDLRWQFAGSPHEDLVTGFNSSPVVVDGVVYIGCRDHNVYALDARLGHQLWRRTTGSTVDSSATVVRGLVLIGSDDHTLWALSTADGAIVWRYATGGGVVSRPCVAGDTAYIGSADGSVHAVDVATGRRRWTMPTGGAIRSSPTAGGGLVYVGSADFRLYALEATSGRRRWSFPTHGPIDDSSPVLVGGTVFIGSLDHRVYALDAHSGAEENLPLP